MPLSGENTVLQCATRQQPLCHIHMCATFFLRHTRLELVASPYMMAPFLKIGLEHNWSGSHQGETTASVSRVHKVVLRHTRLEPVA